jgi:oxygen-independent coproporphyrinogen III oxidase
LPGIYIHIPFCKQACHYCNFHFSTSLGQKEKMVEAIVKEISLTPQLRPFNLSAAAEEEIPKTKAEIKAKAAREIISTLYFGGGTPSILTIDDLKLVFEALQNRFVFADDIEITLEANPDDITDIKLMEWRDIGINRLSVGIQSFVEEELIWMNRVHTAAESITCIDKIRAAGFTNFSVDLIYGSPILSDDDWKRNVAIVIEKNIPHISCYALTVEPKTALDKMIALHKKEPVDAEKQARQFLLLMDWMDQAGYEHYEISNFAKPGLRSKHNSSYWSGEKYYGFGPAAHAYFPSLPGGSSAAADDSPGTNASSRQWNVANNALYIQSLQQNIIPFEEEILTETQQLNEYIMTSLRTSEGLDLEYVSKKFGEEKSSRIKVAGSMYESTGKLKEVNRNLILTKEGKLFADGIAADLFF